MQKIRAIRAISLATLLTFVLTISVFAASVGSIITQGQGKFSVAGEYNHIFDRDLEPTGDATGVSIEERDEWETKLSYGILDCLDIYAKLGAGDAEAKVNWNNGTTSNIKYDYGFTWAVGTKASYKVIEPWILGLDIQYFRTEADRDEVEHSAGAVTNVSGGDATFNELQITGLLGIEFKDVIKNLNFSPYGGFLYSNYEYDVDSFTYTSGGTTYTISGDIEEDEAFGAVVGVNCAYKDNLSLYVEGRFIAETAITVGLSYKF